MRHNRAQPAPRDSFVGPLAPLPQAYLHSPRGTSPVCWTPCARQAHHNHAQRDRSGPLCETPVAFPPTHRPHGHAQIHRVHGTNPVSGMRRARRKRIMAMVLFYCAGCLFYCTFACGAFSIAPGCLFIATGFVFIAPGFDYFVRLEPWCFFYCGAFCSGCAWSIPWRVLPAFCKIIFFFEGLDV